MTKRDEHLKNLKETLSKDSHIKKLHLTNFRKCPLCSDNSFKRLFIKDEFIHVRCNSCNMVYVNPSLEEESTHNIYLNEESYNKVLMNDLQIFESYNDTSFGKKWVSVFGTENPKALMPSGSNFTDDTLSAEVNSLGEVICGNCPLGRMKGSDEWLDLFSREVLVSPFQDGHYIYVVIPGSGTGEDVIAPRICVADGESPKYLHKIMDL